jgi:hypothetical protein
MARGQHGWHQSIDEYPNGIDCRFKSTICAWHQFEEHWLVLEHFLIANLNTLRSKKMTLLTFSASAFRE